MPAAISISQEPKLIVMSDFDGTMAIDDTGNVICDACIGIQTRTQIDSAYLSNKITWRSRQKQCWYPVNMPWYQAVELLKDCRVDPYLPSVIAWCIQHNVPMGVVSAGMQNLIQLVFKRNLTEQERGYLEVFSNTAEIQENGQWRITFRDDSELGHDKAATIESVRNRYASKPKVVFLGDGVSDIASAKKADYLFARRGLDLDVWCNQNNVPHESFDDFSFIAKRLEEINNSL